MTNPIEAAVAPIKEEAIARAEKEERAYIERVRAGLAAANNDINVYAPCADSMSDSREKYMMKNRFRGFIKSLTISRPDQTNTFTPAPFYVDLDSTKIEKHIEQTKEMAASQYEAFVVKLVKKIGDTVSASLEGSHVWGYSFLTVELPSGEKQVWKTQQIVNRSVLGLLFNQWPSRKLKGRA